MMPSIFPLFPANIAENTETKKPMSTKVTDNENVRSFGGPKWKTIIIPARNTTKPTTKILSILLRETHQSRMERGSNNLFPAKGQGAHHFFGPPMGTGIFTEETRDE